MSPGIATLVLFGSMFVLLLAGVPLSFCIGGVGLIFAFFLWGDNSLNVVALQTLGTMRSTVLLALPLFILMANFLQRSGIADDLYSLMYGLLGRVRGGLAVGTVIICTIFAAMAGISGAATVTMGLIALPSMLKRNYSKDIAIGCICAGGALGILIPPSIVMIVYGVMAQVSIGRLFAGGVFPGLVLSALFITYILIRARLNPRLGPPLPPEDRVSLRKMLPEFRALIFPIALVLAVLGSIFSGIATPTEAAAVGALGAMISTALSRRLNWPLIQESGTQTLRLTAMILWIAIAATWFSSTYSAIGGPQFVNQFLQSLGVSRWLVLAGIQFILILLGMVMETMGIIMITVPIFIPIIRAFGFDSLWFGILFVMNMEMGLLTPPFGVNLFYMKGIVPKDVSMGDVYRSIVPFVLLQLTGLIIVIIFPKIATFLPDLIFSR